MKHSFNCAAALLAAACGMAAAQTLPPDSTGPLAQAASPAETLPLPGLVALAQPAPPAEPTRFTAFAAGTRSTLSAGLPDGEAVNVRGVWSMKNGDTLVADVLDEHKFGSHGGVLALA